MKDFIFKLFTKYCEFIYPRFHFLKHFHLTIHNKWLVNKVAKYYKLDGAVGFMLGFLPIIFINHTRIEHLRAEYGGSEGAVNSFTNDVLAHEKTHVKQFWLCGGPLMPLLYRHYPIYRLVMELQAVADEKTFSMAKLKDCDEEAIYQKGLKTIGFYKSQMEGNYAWLMPDLIEMVEPNLNNGKFSLIRSMVFANSYATFAEMFINNNYDLQLTREQMLTTTNLCTECVMKNWKLYS